MRMQEARLSIPTNVHRQNAQSANWTKRQEQQLTELLRDGLNYAEIGFILGRSPGGCKYKAFILGLAHRQSVHAPKSLGCRDKRIKRIHLDEAKEAANYLRSPATIIYNADTARHDSDIWLLNGRPITTVEMLATARRKGFTS